MSRSPTRRVLVCLPAALLREADKHSRKIGETRSATFRQALRLLLNREQEPQAERAA